MEWVGELPTPGGFSSMKRPHGCDLSSNTPATTGREPPDPPPVRVDALADLGAARAERLTDDGGRRSSLAKNGRNAGKVSENCERWRVRRPCWAGR